MDGLVKSNALELLKTFSDRISHILVTPCISYNLLLSEIIALLKSSPLYNECNIFELNLAGAPNTPFFYICDPEYLIILNPKPASAAQAFIFELINIHKAQFNYVETSSATFFIASLSDNLKKRLELPDVLLVNLFHPEMYPTARFTLGVSSIASYLRHTNRAKVTIIDCQFGKSVSDVIKYIHTACPSIIGASVNFGQFDLAEQLINEIYREKNHSYDPILVLGNILPALCFTEVLEKYPKVIVCYREGENTLAELCLKYRTPEQWETIPNIYYKDKNEKLIRTQSAFVSLDTLPPPAFDTAIELIKHDGVFTAEFSRGCQYNICSFCPRTHKGNAWRSLPLPSMVQQIELFHQLSRQFNKKPHIFFADEEFVGPDNNGEALVRLNSLMDRLQAINVHISFDLSCRADQIYDEQKDDEWNIARGYLFRRWVNNGLSRLFVGIESGADHQLGRYQKGYTAKSVASAIRYFSLLGVKLRFGFIFFDPLMTIQDICDNIDFLGRTDIVLKRDEFSTIEDVYKFVKQNHGKNVEVTSSESVYENVSYMLSPLEIFPKSNYLLSLKRHNPELIVNELDMSFARVPTHYIVPEIEVLSQACQIWINFCFPIVYTLKGLQKTSQGEFKSSLTDIIKRHRQISFALLKSLVQSLNLVDLSTIKKWSSLHRVPSEINGAIESIHDSMVKGTENENINYVLTAYADLFKELVIEFVSKAPNSPMIKKDILKKAVTNWAKTSIGKTEVFRRK
ncbi:MAG: hypothetical protein JNM55_20190 [Anaerolineales bacterium]|nr:hypothetical protein [Anaerolineales bacterium]